MTWHPLVWVFWVAAITGGALYAAAAVRAMDVAVNWNPAHRCHGQLRRELRAETASLLGRGAFFCLCVACFLWVAGVAVAWHRIVPGAMCGTGVLQAMGPFGSRAILFWSLTLVLLYAWQVLDRLDRRDPTGVLTPGAARSLLTASPFFLLSLVYSWRALVAVDPAAPVSCCAAAYDQVFSGSIGSALGTGVVTFALWGSLLGSAILVGTASWSLHSRCRGKDVTMAMGTILWVVLAAIAVKQVWSSYYYQVLSHPCPWCLFLPDYFCVGFFIFGCLALAMLEGVALWAGHRVHDRNPELSAAAHRRCQNAAWRILAAIAGYTMATVLPAVHWRISTGVWLNGNHSF